MAAVDYFLKIDGVEGESKDDRHKGEIDVESWSWGQTNSGSHATGGGGGAGKVSMQDFHFTMKTNKASPKLMLYCASGEHIKEAKLVCRKAGTEQREYLTVTLNDLLVSAYQTGGSSAADTLPADQISLNFSKVKVEYREQDARGALGGAASAGWDLKANKKV